MFLLATCREHIDRPEEARYREDWLAIDTRLGIWLFLLLGTLVWLAQVVGRQSISSMASYYWTMAGVALCGFVLHVNRQRIGSDALHSLSWLALCLPLLVQLWI